MQILAEARVLLADVADRDGSISIFLRSGSVMFVPCHRMSNHCANAKKRP